MRGALIKSAIGQKSKEKIMHTNELCKHMEIEISGRENETIHFY